MGKAFNELGMEKSRSICSKRIADV